MSTEAAFFFFIIKYFAILYITSTLLCPFYLEYIGGVKTKDPVCKELVNEAVLRIIYAILEFEAEELVNSS